MSSQLKQDVLRRAKNRSKSGLQGQRRRQHGIVSERAKFGNCEICRWSPGVDMHHVYGRGKGKADWREQSDALLWVCRECHPLPIQTPGFPSDEGGRLAEKALKRIFGDDIIDKHRSVWRDVN